MKQFWDYMEMVQNTNYFEAEQNKMTAENLLEILNFTNDSLAKELTLRLIGVANNEFEKNMWEDEFVSFGKDIPKLKKRNAITADDVKWAKKIITAIKNSKPNANWEQIFSQWLEWQPSSLRENS